GIRDRNVTGVQTCALPISKSKDQAMNINYNELQKKLERFWRVWSREYLTSLRVYRTRNTREPKLGEMVMVECNPKERGSYKIGVIHRLLPSSDGVARKAEIKFLDDPQGKNILVRALKSLAPLERTTQLDRKSVV